MTAIYIVLGDGPPILHDQLLFHLFPILPNRLKSLSIFPLLCCDDFTHFFHYYKFSLGCKKEKLKGMSSAQLLETRNLEINLNIKRKFVSQTRLHYLHIIKVTCWNFLIDNPSCNEHKQIESKLFLILCTEEHQEMKVVPEEEESMKTLGNCSENQGWKDRQTVRQLSLGLASLVSNLIMTPHLGKIFSYDFGSFFF